MKSFSSTPFLTNAEEKDTSSWSMGTKDGARELERLREEIGPDEVLGRLRRYVEIGQSNAARQLTADAARRFPEHAEIQKARRFFDRGGATPNPVTEPETSDEIEWLKHPPDSARDKWVALIGDQVVCMADNARELREALRSRTLPRPPPDSLRCPLKTRVRS